MPFCFYQHRSTYSPNTSLRHLLRVATFQNPFSTQMTLQSCYIRQKAIKQFLNQIIIMGNECGNFCTIEDQTTTRDKFKAIDDPILTLDQNPENQNQLIQATSLSHRFQPEEGDGQVPKSIIHKKSNFHAEIENQQNFQDNIDKEQMKSEKRKEIFQHGVVYQGGMIGAKRHGKGRQQWKDGAVYEGEWRNDKIEGKGKFIHSNGDIYQGEWKDNKAHGYGIYIHQKTKAKYLGYWQNDMHHGAGTEIYSDGTKYEGMFESGKRNGEGIYYFANGQVYSGDWSKGRIQGYGICTWPDGRRYQGYWMDNKKSGYGIFTWPQGGRYEGYYKNDKRHAVQKNIGTYFWPDGRKYVGSWRNDKRDGEGEYILKSGTRKRGIWKEDKRLQWLDKVEEASSQFCNEIKDQ